MAEKKQEKEILDKTKKETNAKIMVCLHSLLDICFYLRLATRGDL